jgi:hypothetical protein
MGWSGSVRSVVEISWASFWGIQVLCVGPDRGMINRFCNPVFLLALARERTKFCLCDKLVLSAVG